MQEVPGSIPGADHVVYYVLSPITTFLDLWRHCINQFHFHLPYLQQLVHVALVGKCKKHMYTTLNERTSSVSTCTAASDVLLSTAKMMAMQEGPATMHNESRSNEVSG